MNRDTIPRLKNREMRIQRRRQKTVEAVRRDVAALETFIRGELGANQRALNSPQDTLILARIGSFAVGLILLLLRPPMQIASQIMRKRFVEVTVALLLLLLTSPVLLCAAILIRLTSRGPIISSQSRAGQYGRVFQIYKFRTMFYNLETATGALWRLKRDPRITSIGRILRKMHIANLPQLWNIVVGDMAFVGPRSERPEFAIHLKDAIEGYERRLLVRPGITGLAQIQLPPDTNLFSVRDKLAFDLLYVKQAGFWLNFRILFGTILYLFGTPFHWIRRIVRLPSPSEIPTIILTDDLSTEQQIAASGTIDVSDAAKQTSRFEAKRL